ncbi:hypothetical protein [Cellulomonas fimi]|uniref:Uncharacterized protein n=1 Tax=Cellulomonas fimi (strain ATCC 484 / DSM 20113 / JCM 1341 / CCUG 24087 / LMG 16345 / NBRC 15513 / NCIMB 8980 / NCTC 7547 / NRS-133) TaxID=590998 RepID=F4H5R4_CELFA|nr:hypothetical protein [Cellulomonas fimi]AEE45514.1 hypothetical protein Celf_1379 [Cellulomonas fimi ATCC 484]NNH07260.1 hypothetical protein [Cellulomonas fimi]VEH29689.1 Uncharacterised protein [Cellulomonas fimi]
MHPTITFDLARQESARRLEDAEIARARARILTARHAADATRRPPHRERAALPLLLAGLLSGSFSGTVAAG